MPNFKIIGLIVGVAILTPLFYGAFASYFWIESSEQSERQLIIARILESYDGPISHFSRGERTSADGHCETIAYSLQGRSYQPEIVKSGLLFRARAQQHSEVGAMIRDARSEPLEKWPNFAIGALDACNRSTPLSPICRAIVSTKLHQLSKTERRDIIDKVNRDAEPGWCAALDMIDPKLKNSRVSFDGKAI